MSPDMPAMTDDALNTIRARNERLREVPFDGTHDGREHGDNCVPCELVRGVGDVTALLEENGRLRAHQDGVDRWLCYASDLEAKLGDERARANAAEGRLAEIGETEVEWGYWHDDEFNISDRQFSAGDIRYYLEQSGRPVERRLAGKWRKVEPEREP